jgi:hypothetical protein
MASRGPSATPTTAPPVGVPGAVTPIVKATPATPLWTVATAASVSGGTGGAGDDDEELDGFRGALYKRKDYLDVEEEGETTLLAPRNVSTARS